MGQAKKRNKNVPYHCGIYIAPDSTKVELSIAWRRVGDKEYGVYVASGGQGVIVMSFLACYSPKGEMQFFYILDGLPQEQECWDLEALSGREQQDLIGKQERDAIICVANSFFSDWIETVGASDVNKLFKKLGAVSISNNDDALSVVSSGLPLQVKGARMPDFWAFLDKSSEKWHFAFISGLDSLSQSRDALLLSKMRLFLEFL